MALVCGCEVVPGAPISQAILRDHAKHTLGVLFFWELLIGTDPKVREKFMYARLEIQAAMDAVAPGWGD